MTLTLADRPRVLAVDDDEMSLMVLEKILGDEYELVKVHSGAEGMQILKAQTFDLVLLDYLMPDLDGMTMLRQLRARLETSEVPIIMLTGDMTAEREAEGFRAGVTDFLHKPFIPDVLRLRVQRILRYEYLQSQLEQEVARQTALANARLQTSQRIFNQVVLALAQTVDVKDHYTHGHSERVAQYAQEISRRLGDDASTQARIHSIAMLHDIGKIGIPAHIINKPTRLTDEEYALIQSHTTLGAEILQTVREFPELAVGARSHHERWDGHGYPDGLAGEAIARMARSIAVADAYDAMTSRRSYRDPLPQAVVHAEIAKGRGTQFDPLFADIMLQMIEEDTDFTMRDTGH